MFVRAKQHMCSLRMRIMLRHSCLQSWQDTARCMQITYIIGATGRSFVTGYGQKAPRSIHHRDAALTLQQSGNWTVFNDASIPSANQLIGGLVGGPDLHDGYRDVRADYKRNEVAVDYNAALIAGTVQCLLARQELVWFEHSIAPDR